MTQSVQLTKLEYAHNYDIIADELYRLTLYLLGDIKQTRHVMASLFVEGFISQTEQSFEQGMLKKLWKLLAECEPVCGEQYLINLLKTVELSSENEDYGRLFEMLGTMQLIERSVLLLSVLNRQSLKQIAWILDLPQGELSRMNKEICAKVRQTMAA